MAENETLAVPTGENVTFVEDGEAIQSVDLDTAFNMSPPSEGAGEVRLSQEIIQFLESIKESPQEVLLRPVVTPPEVDDSQPLSHYYISTSHNTYLLSYQLMGKADASAYTRVLSHHCRCVEIDAWEGEKEPIVTHGWTWSEHITFRDVCIAIGNAVQPEDWPLMVSLECHVGVTRQEELVAIMREIWGEKLLDREIQGLENPLLIAPKDLRGKIVLMVEYYPPKVADVPSSTSSSSSDDTDVNCGSLEEHKISPELAALGVYSRSIKPRTGWLTRLVLEPQHILYNLSEKALGSLIPASLQDLVENSLKYMRRVYPKGTRITSANLSPIKHWRSGTHISALNWQKYDRGLQFNEAMFVGTQGWVLKPEQLRGLKAAQRRPVRLTCQVIGACNIPKATHDVQAYIYAELFCTQEEKKWKSSSRHQSSTLPPDAPSGDFLWNEKFHWDFTEDDIVFVRLSIYQNEWGKDDRLGTFCARLEYLQMGWRFIRLFNKKGKHNGGILLVKFTYV